MKLLVAANQQQAPPPPEELQDDTLFGMGGSIPGIERRALGSCKKEKNIILVPTTERGAWFFTKFVRGP